MCSLVPYKDHCRSAATVLYSLIASGKGAGWEPIQRDYYKLSQRLSKQQQVEQTAKPGLPDVQREKWASMQEVEDGPVAPLRRLLDQAGVGTRPLSEMGMAEFLLARSYFSSCPLGKHKRG